MIKKVLLSYTETLKHWLGNGLHVHGFLRASGEINSIISPFIMMNYANPLMNHWYRMDNLQ